MNKFDIRAIEHERHALKQIKKTGSLFTCTNRENFIKKVDGKFIYFRTNHSKSIHKVPREHVRKAISFLLYKRSVTRQQLEKFHNFSSFLMGFLRLALVDIKQIARIQVLRTRAYRIVMKAIRFWFAGLDRDPQMMYMVGEYTQAPGNWILMSYWNLRHDKHENWKKNARKHKCKILLDSGEFSYFKARRKLRAAQRLLATMIEGTYQWSQQLLMIEELRQRVAPISIKEYAEFVKRHQDILFGCFNLDVVGNPIRSKMNANFLKSQGLNPIEIWHPQSGFEALGKLVSEDHDLIAIGGLVFLSDEERTEVLDNVFALYPDQPFHILGCSSSALYRYPIHSSDSTGPIMGRRYLSLITETGHDKADVDHSWHEWNEDEALVFNIRQLSRLEEAYDGVQIELVTPPVMHTGVQLTIF
ncbi:hypothetical protein EHV15_34055 [Paenibacillus oralis]|uniref:Uncharacterized protein n=1 Tax=Paenibacillus oralis TaxID=2490856 RepID=A0A3P3TDV6_9BACL|nr:hypothetical protein [Paenibacillus oralis]RRJ54623.1 hypothetical protein EHV15_34055 [Paenibacillus oralis]